MKGRMFGAGERASICRRRRPFVVGDIAIVGYPGRAELEKAVKFRPAPCGKAAC